MSSSASSFQIIFTQKTNQSELFWKTKQHMLSDVQELLSALFIRRKSEPKYSHTAIPYKSPSIRTRQKHHIGFCTPVSVPFIACRRDEFNWRLVTSLYLKKKTTKTQPPIDNTVKNSMKNTNVLPQTQRRFLRAGVLHCHSMNPIRLLQELWGSTQEKAPKPAVPPQPFVFSQLVKLCTAQNLKWDQMGRGAAVPCSPPLPQHSPPLLSTGPLLYMYQKCSEEAAWLKIMRI